MTNIDWHTGAPEKEGIYLCKVEGMKFIRHITLAWEDGSWWQYFVDYTGRTDIEGWFGIGLMKVKEWTLIEELKD